MRTRLSMLALTASLLCATSASGLAEFGIEGMGVVSTKANEGRASISADGQQIVWASDRPGGAGGWDLWQARLQGGRWSDPQPLALDSASDELDPFFSADGRWLYFASDRDSRGHADLYRAPVQADGRFGAAQSLGAGVNGKGDERAPALSLDGTRLLFVRGKRGDAAHALLVARWAGQAFSDPQPLAGVDGDVLDASWLGDGRALLFARSEDADSGHARLWLAPCVQGRYVDATPLAVSFNVAGGVTRGAVPDTSKPGELLLDGSARAPRAGGLDIYRMKTPTANGDGSCQQR